MATSTRLRTCLYSFTSPGAPMYPTRAVRHAAWDALDLLYPVELSLHYLNKAHDLISLLRRILDNLWIDVRCIYFSSVHEMFNGVAKYLDAQCT